MQEKTRDMLLRMALNPTPPQMSADAYADYEKADQLCCDASEYLQVNDVDEAIKLSIEGVKVSQYCSDAWNILAQAVGENPGESLILYRWGMRVGEIYLGERFFKEERGSFWGLIQSRPYMRCRLGVVNSLRALGCHD